EPELSLDDLENELLSGGSNAYQAPAESVATESDDVVALEEVEGDEPEQPQAQAFEAEESLDEDFLKLDDSEISAALEEEITPEVALEPEADDLDIEFDLSELDLDSLDELAAPAESVAEQVQPESGEASELELMDFDLGDLEEAAATSEQSNELETELGLDTLADSSVLEESSELGEMSFDEAPLLEDRKSTRLNSRSRENLVCRLLLEKKKKTRQDEATREHLATAT